LQSSGQAGSAEGAGWGVEGGGLLGLAGSEGVAGSEGWAGSVGWVGSAGVVGSLGATGSVGSAGLGSVIAGSVDSGGESTASLRPGVTSANTRSSGSTETMS